MEKIIFCILLLITNTHAMATESSIGQSNRISLTLFVLIICITLCITWWASKKTQSTSDFYAAGGKISGFQNGLAITGDALSAGAFLGLTALVFNSGFDGLIYAIGYTTGLPIVVFLMASRLRKLGKYTFTDVVCSKLKGTPIRIFSAMASLIIVSFYLIAQMVGAGQLIQLLFGINYNVAIMLVGSLMVLYVVFGGMMATTWVQIIKAILMLGIGVVISVLVMARFDFSFIQLLQASTAIHPDQQNILIPQALAKDPVSGISLAIALMLGTAGLPHVLMRFFTVPDAKAARTSVLWSTIFMNSFYAMIFIIGFGALALLNMHPEYFDGKGGLIGGSNTAALHLSHLLGGDIMFGAVSAIAFSTILAVVAGLTLSGASAISHDIYSALYKKGDLSSASELKIVRISTIVLGVFAVFLGIIFKGQNVAYMISLAFSIACSSTFPVLILSIYWKKLTSIGAVAGGGIGLLSSLLFTIMGPSIWVKVFGFSQALFPIDPPAIVTVPLAFIVCIVVSLLTQPKNLPIHIEANKS
ncbi:cation/acetate symporter ActP [Acinetobacter qingfengensis]|uniref:Cation acetate symporter n=1 Tax=Acinetobacter qingfengensis TaxID=1262585 RepID=A0A1E7R3M7_9GAMM|nr:cation/acetate symporter ActP [Acinetobacter qingfengensis]KAA8735587.1 cation/acetate symporter ActP [Acinetobacter qingfengensis]OEY93873.1 cation acetate symporter [Acinetobacter qingfengensis]